MMYLFNNEKKELEEILEVMSDILLNREDYFCDYLDEIYPPIEVCGISFYASDVLKNCGPVAFDCYFGDWVDDEIYDYLEYELERLSDGEIFEFYGNEITAIEEEDEENE